MLLSHYCPAGEGSMLLSMLIARKAHLSKKRDLYLCPLLEHDKDVIGII